jgi:hypothetical protein
MVIEVFQVSRLAASIRFYPIVVVNNRDGGGCRDLDFFAPNVSLSPIPWKKDVARESRKYSNFSM